MVRTINFYYNNRTVQAVQELKNRPGELKFELYGYELWLKFIKTTLILFCYLKYKFFKSLSLKNLLVLFHTIFMFFPNMFGL